MLIHTYICTQTQRFKVIFQAPFLPHLFRTQEFSWLWHIYKILLEIIPVILLQTILLHSSIFQHCWATTDPTSISCEAVIINRLRLGHCHLTHSYLMPCDNQPVCESCRLPLSQAYITWLSKSAGHSTKVLYHFIAERPIWTCRQSNIIDFVKEIHFYNQL